MAEVTEKRGPIEKGEKGWPINPLGVLALVLFALIALFLIAKPLFERSKPDLIEQGYSTGGRIISPRAGEIITADKVSIELSVDEPQKTQSVQFWVKTYADGKWQMIGEVEKQPYKIDWQIPSEFQNKSIAITAHIYQKGGNIVKDPGGWREGIIILATSN
jgi:hypothetical protein